MCKPCEKFIENLELNRASPLQLFTPWRVRWYSNGLLIGLALAFLVVVFSSSGVETFTGLIGGDFPSFYSAGNIVADGNGATLYSPDQQLAYQKALIGNRATAIPFAYPPHTALFYVPLSQLPFRFAYLVHSIAMVAALVLACGLLQRMYPQAIKSAHLLFALALTSFPIFWSVLLGLNTALSILLIVAVFYNVTRGRNLWAGFFLGLLFFKPQFAIPLAGLFFLSGRWQVWLNALLTLAALIVAGAVIVDPEGLQKWLDATYRLFTYNVSTLDFTVISIMGLADALGGHSSGIAQLLGWGGTAAASLVISWIWFVGGRRSNFGAQMALATLFTILIAPLTAFYDAGLALIPVVLLFGVMGRPSLRLVIFLWLTSYLQIVSEFVGVSLLPLPILVLLVLALHHLWGPATRSATVDS